MDYLSFIPAGIPASSRLVYRPVYPQEVQPVVDIGDRHDGERKRRDYEEERRRKWREDRDRLTQDLRDAVASITGRPPPLDASPKQLAAIARKSEAIDYRAVIAEIERLRAEERAIKEIEALLATERENYEREQQRIRIRRQDEEALLLLLLN